MPTDGIKPVKLVETLGARFTLCGREDTIETLRNGGGTECSNVNRLKLFLSENPPEDRNLYPISFLAGGGPGTGKVIFCGSVLILFTTRFYILEIKMLNLY